MFRTPKGGYLQAIRYDMLIRAASAADAVVYLPYRPGNFLVEDSELAAVWPPEAADRMSRSLKRAQVTGPVRTLAQDPAFGIDQLVEIAIRALSPAVNDTYTALTCVDWLPTLCASSRKCGGRHRPIATATAPSGSSASRSVTKTWSSGHSTRSARPVVKCRPY